MCVCACWQYCKQECTAVVYIRIVCKCSIACNLQLSNPILGARMCIIGMAHVCLISSSTTDSDYGLLFGHSRQFKHAFESCVCVCVLPYYIRCMHVIVVQNYQLNICHTGWFHWNRHSVWCRLVVVSRISYCQGFNLHVHVPVISAHYICVCCGLNTGRERSVTDMCANTKPCTHTWA